MGSKIGAHTVTHPVLAALSLSAQRDEVERSKSDLEALLNRRITSFAYPYGARAVYNDATVATVREAAFHCACTTDSGLIDQHRDRFLLPRAMVLDWDGPTFAERLLQWFDESSRDDAELLVDLAQRQIIDAVVDDDPERAVVVVLADEDNALAEALIRHGRRRDQKAANQRGGGGSGSGHGDMFLQIHGDCPVKGQDARSRYGSVQWTKWRPPA